MSLAFRDVEVRYGRRIALQAASLSAPDGRVTGFLGHNGAGKTTAMRAAIGFLPFRSGSIAIDGFDPRRDRREVLARCGSLIEQCRFHDRWSGERNLYELARLSGLSRGDAKRAARTRIEQVGLADAATRAVGGYSQGMRQRLGIAQALLASPRNVLLDEPTNGLDPDGIAEMRALMAELAHVHGCAVLLSSHQLDEVSKLADRVVVLKAGQVVAEGETRGLLADPARRTWISGPERSRLSEALAREGLATRPANGGAEGLEVELGSREPSELLERIVRAGIPVEHFAARPISLEEFYLHASHGPGAARAESETSATPASTSSTRLAPGHDLSRTLRHELARLRSSPLLLALPAVVGAALVWRDVGAAARAAAEVEGETLFSATGRTAFSLSAASLVGALPFLALLTVGFASQLFAAEHGRGTLRNLVARPLGRIAISLGKGLVAVGAALLGYLALVAAAAAVARANAEFGDLYEILPNGNRFPILSAGEAWPEFRAGLRAPLVPLAAAAALGLLAGALVRSGAAALALGLGSWLALDLARGFLAPAGRDGWLVTAYLPSFLGNRSRLDASAQFLDGATNAIHRHAETQLWVPLTWLAGAWALSSIRFARRRFS